MELCIPSTTTAAGKANVERLAGLSFDPYQIDKLYALGTNHGIMQEKHRRKVRFRSYRDMMYRAYKPGENAAEKRSM